MVKWRTSTVGTGVKHCRSPFEIKTFFVAAVDEKFTAYRHEKSMGGLKFGVGSSPTVRRTYLVLGSRTTVGRGILGRNRAVQLVSGISHQQNVSHHVRTR